MTNTKSTKRALLTSVMALLLCFTMLLGTTYAWFTDSVTSSGNKIKAGNLDVALLMYDAEEGEYVDIGNESKPIFGSANSSAATANNANTLWEPGKTQVAYLAIKNAGTLDLKCTVALDVSSSDDKNLHEVMQYAIERTDAPYEGSDGSDGSVTSWDELKANSVVSGIQPVSDHVTLKAGQTHYFALSIHMMESATSNYADGSIEFDLTVLATQLASEKDSFDNTYDAKATYPVATVDELKAAIATGMDVVLTDDIVITDPLNITTPTMIDLNDKTLTVSHLEARGELTINSGTLVNGVVSEVAPAISVVEGGTLTLNEVTVISKNPIFDGVDRKGVRYAEFVGIEVSGGTCVLNDCDITVEAVEAEDGIRDSNFVMGIVMSSGSLTMNRGSITVTSVECKISAYDYQSAIYAYNEKDKPTEKTVTLIDVTIDTDGNSLLYAWGGNTTIYTNEPEGTYPDNLFNKKSGGTYEVIYN